MSGFPESIDPDEEQKLVEKLIMDHSDYKFLEFIRKHMRLIYAEENRQKQEDPPNDE